MNDIVIAETLKDVSAEVLNNGDNISILTDIVNNLADLVLLNGDVIVGLKESLAQLTDFSIRTSDMFMGTFKTLLNVGAENLDKISNLEMVMENITEQLNSVSLYANVSLSLGTFNTIVLFGLIYMILKRK